MQKIIRFNRKHQEYGCFSNFAPYPIEIMGETWPTVEHYFQVSKFHDRGYQELIRLTPSPKKWETTAPARFV